MARRGAELSLLSSDCDDHLSAEQLERTPLLTFDAYDQAIEGTFPQTGLLGGVVEAMGEASEAVLLDDRRLYLNTNTAWSGIICGAQGSSNAHTVSVILENCFIQDERIGELQEPIAGVVFHFDPVVEGSKFSLCEAAYLGSILHPTNQRGIPITVLVSPSNLTNMANAYSNLPNVTVAPLYIFEENVSTEDIISFITCGSFGFTSDNIYCGNFVDQLRNMFGDAYNIKDLSRLLDTSWLLSDDCGSLMEALKTLRGFVLYEGTREELVKTFFKPGELVIVDLTDPFLDASSSSCIFDMILRIFVDQDLGGKGKIVVLDKAHQVLIDAFVPELRTELLRLQYLETNSAGLSTLTDRLIYTILQKQILGVRTIISTEKPDVLSPTLLCLVSFVCLHRLASSACTSYLHRCLGYLSSSFGDSISWFDLAQRLRRGEALVSCASATVMKIGRGPITAFDFPFAAPLDHGYLKIQIRKRITVPRCLMTLYPLNPVEETPILSATAGDAATGASTSDSVNTELLLASPLDMATPVRHLPATPRSLDEPSPTSHPTSGPSDVSIENPLEVPLDSADAEDAKVARAFVPFLRHIYRKQKGVSIDGNSMVSISRLGKVLLKQCRNIVKVLGQEANSSVSQVVAEGVRRGLMQADEEQQFVGLTSRGLLEISKS